VPLNLELRLSVEDSPTVPGDHRRHSLLPIGEEAEDRRTSDLGLGLCHEASPEQVPDHWVVRGLRISSGPA